MGWPPGEALKIELNDITAAAFLRAPPLRVGSIVQSNSAVQTNSPVSSLLNFSVMGVLIENWNSRAISYSEDRNDGTKLTRVTNQMELRGVSIVLVYDGMPKTNGTNATRFIGIASANRFSPVQ